MGHSFKKVLVVNIETMSYLQEFDVFCCHDTQDCNHIWTVLENKQWYDHLFLPGINIQLNVRNTLAVCDWVCIFLNVYLFFVDHYKRRLDILYVKSVHQSPKTKTMIHQPHFVWLQKRFLVVELNCQQRHHLAKLAERWPGYWQQSHR